MISAGDFAGALERNTSIVKRQTDGLSDEEALLRVPTAGNCLNWVLGHLAVYRDDTLKLLGETQVMGDAGIRYRRGSEPVSMAEDGVLTLTQLVGYFERTGEKLAAAVGRMTEADLNREITIGERTTTLGQRLFFFYFHETYHVGQTELFRQLAGREDKII